MTAIAETIDLVEQLEDESVAYFIVNTDLNMGLGKTAAQVGHAVHYLMTKREETLAMIDCWSPSYGQEEHKKLVQQAFDFNRWTNSGTIAKIVLAADTNEFNKVKTEFEGRCVIVRDAGRTEIAPGSETVIGLHPMLKSTVSKTIKRLRLLK